MNAAFNTLVVAGLLAGTSLSVLAQTPRASEDKRAHRTDARRMHPEKIAAAQETHWTAFANRMKPPASHTQPAINRAELDKLTVPERLDKHDA
jgi:periplasmic protein CpxP/Spy